MRRNWYRKYRPIVFEDVLGQVSIVQTIVNSIRINKLSHAYMFSGPRGTGKTTTARIFARSLLCKKPVGHNPCNTCISCKMAFTDSNVDLIEIDAASNNGIDEIRSLNNSIELAPSDSKYKVYIIDEVHMLTIGAFNALLKTLEEPPEHAVFILATTDVHKVPETVISRCQNFDFKNVDNSNIMVNLNKVLLLENGTCTVEVLNNIISKANGGMRNAINMLEQLFVLSNGSIDLDTYEEMYGSLSTDIIDDFLKALFNCDVKIIKDYLFKFETENINVESLLIEVLNLLKVMIFNSTNSNLIPSDFIYECFDFFNKTFIKITTSRYKMLLFQMEIMKFTETRSNIVVDKTFTVKEASKAVIEPVLVEEKGKKVKVDLDVSCETSEKQIISQEIICLGNNEFEEEVNIRINNMLIDISRQERDKIKKDLMDLRKYLLNENTKEAAYIISRLELVAVGNGYCCFVVGDDLYSEFYLNLSEIEIILSEISSEEYKVIGILLDEWNSIKKEYSKKRGNYEKMNKKNDIILLAQKKFKASEAIENTIELTFGDKVVYK